MVMDRFKNVFNGEMIRPRNTPGGDQVDYLGGGGNPQPSQSIPGYTSPVEFRTVDLTTAHTDMSITVPKCAYIQAVSDGVLDGISIKLIDQSRQSIDLKKVNTIPGEAITRIYLTNDVRQGRSLLTLIFCLKEPFVLTSGSENISLAELAVRNNSIDIFDRRGEVIFIDDFSGNMNKYIIAGSAGYSAIQATTKTDKSDVNLKLITPAVISNYITVSKYLPYFALSNFSAEFDIAIPSNTLGQYTVYLHIYSGAISLSGGVRYDASTGKIQYYTGSLILGASWVDLSTSIVLNTNPFHIMKVVTDPIKGNYRRVIVDKYIHDIPTAKLYTGASLTDANLNGVFSVINTDGTSLTCYLDHCIIKQNEP